VVIVPFIAIQGKNTDPNSMNGQSDSVQRGNRDGHDCGQWVDYIHVQIEKKPITYVRRVSMFSSPKFTAAQIDVRFL
jgi:hypothetical protein